MVRLISGGSVRPLRPMHRSVSGRVALKDGRSAGYESSLERDWLITLDFDWRVTFIQEQPYTLQYMLDDKRRRYTPDILAEFDDGTRRWTAVYEVKMHEELQAEWQRYRPRFKAAMADCRSKGWRFHLVTERRIRTAFLGNAKFLRPYRRVPERSDLCHQILQALSDVSQSTPLELLSKIWPDQEHRTSALPELWRLIATGQIAADLQQSLTMTTRIWMKQ